MGFSGFFELVLVAEVLVSDMSVCGTFRRGFDATVCSSGSVP